MTTREKKRPVAPEVAAVWEEYLTATRGHGERYEDVEAHAWALLKSRLRKLGVRLRAPS